MKHLIVSLLAILLVGCGSAIGVGFTPAIIPIRIGVTLNQNGVVSVSASVSGTFVTPIGVFDIDAGAARELRSERRTLTVIVEDEEWVYDLEFEEVRIEFHSTDYCNVKIETRGDDTLVYAARNGSSECRPQTDSPEVIREVTKVVTSTAMPPQDTSPPTGQLPPPQPTLPSVIPTTPPRTCDIEVHSAFRNTWSAIGGADVSCPTRAAESYQGGIQYYDHGVMIWVPPTSYEPAMVYVIHSNSNRDWQEYVDYWNESQPETRGNPPPPGKVEPKRGFGLVWLDQLGGPSATIGWAVSQESATMITIQKLNGTGMAIQVGGTVYYMPHGRGWVN